MITKGCLMSSNRYITDKIIKRNFSYYLWIGIYSVWSMETDTYPQVTKIDLMCFVLLPVRWYMLPDRLIILCQTFRFYYVALNFVKTY